MSGQVAWQFGSIFIYIHTYIQLFNRWNMVVFCSVYSTCMWLYVFIFVTFQRLKLLHGPQKYIIYNIYVQYDIKLQSHFYIYTYLGRIHCSQQIALMSKISSVNLPFTVSAMRQEVRTEKHYISQTLQKFSTECPMAFLRQCNMYFFELYIYIL